MHLHVITIVDYYIASADGNYIFTAASKCCQGNGLRKQIIWLGLEDKVPSSWIELWQTTLHFFLCKLYSRPDERIKLDMLLGDW